MKCKSFFFSAHALAFTRRARFHFKSSEATVLLVSSWAGTSPDHEMAPGATVLPASSWAHAQVACGRRTMEGQSPSLRCIRSYAPHLKEHTALGTF